MLADPTKIHSWLFNSSSAIAGFFGGIAGSLFATMLSEPIKLTIQRRFSVNRMRKATRQDVFELHMAWSLVKGGGMTREKFWQLAAMPNYEYVVRTSHDLFADDFEMNKYRLRLFGVHTLIQSVRDKVRDMDEAGPMMETCLNHFINEPKPFDLGFLWQRKWFR